MVQELKKTRIAFILPEDQSWTGGVNYLKNLLFAVKTAGLDDFEPILYVGKKTDEKHLELFKDLAEIRKNIIFDKRLWMFRKIMVFLFGRDTLCTRLFIKDQVDIVSHYLLPGSNHSFKVINWIPDFQHVHLPMMFRGFEVKLRNKWLSAGLIDCDRMILSSFDARKDCIAFDPSCEAKTSVLHFVAQCNDSIYTIENIDLVCEQFSIPRKFYYIPNQFWAHKNHSVVFEALHLLKEAGHDIHVVCTGATADYRNSEYFAGVLEKITEYGLQENVHILGLIDYDHVLALFRHSVSVINPSLFEGWSTSVEEAKSVGKNIILSDIPVHREQDPSDACFFHPKKPDLLAAILKEKWELCSGGPDYELEKEAREGLVNRTIEFGRNYQRIINEVL